MTNKELLQNKIQKGYLELENLKKKREALDIAIQNKEMKIRNQEFQLQHLKVERQVEKIGTDQLESNEISSISIADQILR